MLHRREDDGGRRAMSRARRVASLAESREAGMSASIRTSSTRAPGAPRALRSLLVPLDGSSFGEQALPVAVAIARRARASLHLIHVHRPAAVSMAAQSSARWDDEIRESEWWYLEREAGLVADAVGLTVTRVIGSPPVVEALCRRASEVEADLIVMTSHGRTGLARAWLGSVADGVLRQAEVPVLLIRPREQSTLPEYHALFHRVLIPLDGSALAESVVEPATALGALGAARYQLLEVVVPAEGGEPAPAPGAAEAAAAPQPRGDVAQAEGYLAGVAARLRERGLAVEPEVCVDERPAQVILDRAREGALDLVAMATHGRGASRLLVGSVADAVLRGTSLPLLLFRPRAA